MVFKFSSVALILSLLLASSSDARFTHARPDHANLNHIRDSSKLTLGFAHQVKLLTGSKTLAQLDRERAVALVSNTTGKIVSNNAKNTAVTYTMTVGIGSPPVDYTLLIDTGSANTWVGASKKYVKTSTSKKTTGQVSVNYGSGSFTGIEYTDLVTLAPGLSIPNQSIGVATNSSGFSDIDGILGIGPTDLTAGTVSTAGTVPTVTDNLMKAGIIASNSLGIFFKPAENSAGTGELTWGGVDNTKVVGGVNYVGITATTPAANYWGIDQSLVYGNKTIISKAAGIVDTGTSLVLLATDYFHQYQAQIGANVDKKTGLIKITPAQYAKLQPLHFKIGKHTYTLTPNAQIFPRALNSAVGGDKGSIYLIVSDLGQTSGQGLDFINGYAFLESFYSVYDTANHRVGFAETAYTNAVTN